jgi:hypothetical protein
MFEIIKRQNFIKSINNNFVWNTIHFTLQPRFSRKRKFFNNSYDFDTML